MRKANSLTAKLFNRTYNLAHSSSYSRHLAKQIHEAFLSNPPDVVIAPAFSTAISYLKTSVPVIYISDTTFRLLYGYYEWFSNFWPWSVREGDRLESRAIDTSTFSVFASEWAARSAIEHYHARPDKVKVIPFGANLVNRSSEESILKKEKGSHCRLIFIGMEWNRKGGPLVMETLQKLRESGIPAELDIVGCDPPIQRPQQGIRIFPRIDKSTPEGSRLFDSLMGENHFLFVPSRAECFGVVFAEASAYGLPSITTDTGGIPDVVINGENGFRLPLTAGPEDYARTIADLYNDFNERYRPLSLSSYHLYKSHLNWDRWADQMVPVILAAHDRHVNY